MPTLLLVEDQEAKQTYTLREGLNTIGRSESNSICVPHSSLSRQHAQIWISGSNAVIQDLASMNGTLVDGVRITEQTLTARHTIRCGDIEFTFLPDDAPLPRDSRPSLVYDIEKDPLRRSLKDMLAMRGTRVSSTRCRCGGSEEQAREKLQILLKVSQLLSSPASLEDLIDRILELAFEILKIDRGLILMLDGLGVPQVRAMRVRTEAGQPADFSRHIVEHVIREGTAALFSDPRTDPRVPEAPSILAQSICTCMCVPLKPRDRLIGALYVDNLHVSGCFGPGDLEFLAAFANQAAIAIDHAQLGSRLAEEAVRRSNLQRFFPPSTIDLLLRSGAALTPVETRATVLFSDISDYTELSSKMTPSEVISLLNVYFPPMADIVFRHEGTLEKYIGDALLALWGAPFVHRDDPVRAVSAAAGMQVALRRLVDDGLLPSHLQIHVGINTGVVAAGNIGSGDYVQYATIGDATNVASRICGVARAGEIVIDECTAELVGGSWPLQPIGPVRLKGKSDPMSLFRVAWG